MRAVWEEKVDIKGHEVGPDGKLKLFSLFNYLQEVAGNHADNLGWGYEAMQIKNCYWVLSRMQIKIYQMPQWGDHLIIETWPGGIERLFAVRDFTIKNEKGDILISAVSGWLILDTNNHRILNPSIIISEIPEHDKKGLIKLETAKIKSFERIIKTYERTASFTELDINNHVNNAKYIDWVLDSYEGDFLMNFQPKNVLISYNSETKYHNSVSLKLSESIDKFI